MVESLGVGIAWIMVLFGIGGGIPAGMPPAAEEPYMFQIAPEKCLFFTSWVSVGEVNPDSANATEKFIAEPELQALLKKVELVFRQAAAKANGSSATGRVVAEKMPDITKLLFTRATSIYVSEFELRGEDPHFAGAAVVSLGPQEEATRRNLSAINEAFAAEADLQTVSIAGAEFVQMRIPEGENVVTWGIHDTHLIIAFGEKQVETLLANGKTPPPAWLKSQKQELTVDRFAAMSYVDIESIIGIARENITDRGADRFFDFADMWGLLSFKSYRTVTGLDAEGVIDRSVLELTEERRGLLKAIGDGELTADHLNRLPSDPLAALAIQIDPKEVYAMIEERPEMLLGMLDRESFDKMIEGAESVVSASFKDDLIGSLGDAIYLYAAPNDGGLITGWTLAIDVDQSMTIDQIMQRLIGFAKATMLMNGSRDVTIETQTIDGTDIHYFRAEDMPFSFSFSLVNDQLLLAAFPQAIKGHLARQKTNAGLGKNPHVATAIKSEQNGRLTTLSYLDTQELIRQVYPLLILGATGIQNELLDGDPDHSFDISVVDIPSVDSLARHLKPAVTTTHATDTAYFTTSRHVLPTGTIGTTAPAAVALLLPAVSAARMAAKRVQSKNNMKQIGLALHNYHDVFKAMPAPYSTDEAGKPLLSWRVHVLPFIEEQALYEQFRLDEPWDSEHNKTLIEKMPISYQFPGRDGAEGKTVYQGVAGEGCMFGPESVGEKAKEKFPQGNGLRDILDGTSNTIIVVETNRGNAVTWTRPEDFQAPEMEPVERLIGNWNGVFHVLMGDGSVQALPNDIDVDKLRRYFTMAEGTPIEQ